MAATAGKSSDETARLVRHFRQILLWPVQLTPENGRHVSQRWAGLCRNDNPWFPVEDEFPRAIGEMQVRHYSEFVTFLPAVQRFLYGDPRQSCNGERPVRVFRRGDVDSVRVTFKDRSEPLRLSVAHVDLYFFYDIDVAVFTVEVSADDIDLDLVQELLFRFGRAFPAGWDSENRGDHCLERTEWLDADGRVLAVSDFEERQKYLSAVCRERTVAISSDWEFLLSPLVPDLSDRSGALRFRQLEYNRMPRMAYLAMDEPWTLSRADFARLVFATRSGAPGRRPVSEAFLKNFEEEHCYDRFWGVDDPSSANSRYLCSDHTFITVGDHAQHLFADAEQGVLSQFRHQYFLLVLIAHFHKAALLMFADRLSSATSRLDIRDAERVREFKRAIRELFAVFLRFTHRYWFREVTIQASAKAVFALLRRHHGTDALYEDIRVAVQDMAQYLEADGMRRQANTVVRLTVVTIFGLIGSVATGLLGMNLLAAADEPMSTKILLFLAAVIPTAVGTLYTVMISKRLSDMLESLSDERLPLGVKVRLFTRVWFGGRGDP